MAETKMRSIRLAPLVLVAGFAAVGCGASTLAAPDASPAGTNKAVKFKGPPSNAGLEVKENTDATAFPKLVKNPPRRYVARTNPFALTSTEKTFDSEQSSERIFGNVGFSTLVEPKSEVAPVVYVEPQPYRRLSGIVVGDSVVAIIEMGQGQEAQIIRPGMVITGTEWTVVSIDQDKAVLRRSGNVLPHEIQVRLEVAPPGFGPANTGAGAGAGRGFPGGPGGFPGGGPGGPGGRFPGGRGGPGGRFPGGGGGPGRFGGGGGAAGAGD